MASAMSDHLRSLRPALALGPAAGGPSWADRIVYSIGSFDIPRLSSNNTPPAGDCASTTATPATTTATASSHAPPAAAGQAAAVLDAVAAEATVEGSRLRFLREFGAVVVVGVYTDMAHAACHGGVPPEESLEDRCARVRPHADRVVAIDAPEPARVREILLGAGAGGEAGRRRWAESSQAAHVCVPGSRNNVVHDAVGWGRGSTSEASVIEHPDMTGIGYSSLLKQHQQQQKQVDGIFMNVTNNGNGHSNGNGNCCFVTCDWEGRGAGTTEVGRRARRETRAVMERSMPVFRLPSPTWARGSSADGGGGGKDGNEGGR